MPTQISCRLLSSSHTTDFSSKHPIFAVARDKNERKVKNPMENIVGLSAGCAPPSPRGRGWDLVDSMTLTLCGYHSKKILNEFES